MKSTFKANIQEQTKPIDFQSKNKIPRKTFRITKILNKHTVPLNAGTDR